MAKLPTRESLGGLPAVPTRPAKSLRGPDTRAIGRGVADLGRGVQQAAAVLATADTDAQKYNAEAAFQDFKWNHKQSLDQSMFDIKPDEVDGFAERWAGSYAESAQKFLDTLSDPLKDAYNLKLKATERQYFGHAAQFMRGEQKRTALNRLDEMNGLYLQRLQTGTPLDEVESDYTGLVAANPYLSEIDKAARLRKDLNELEIVHAKSRWEAGEDPDRVMRDLGGVLLDIDENPELRPQPQTEPAVVTDRALISARLETGKTDPLEGVANISKDAGGTKSYGNFGLNSQKGGSIFDFVKDYGNELGLKGRPGTNTFDQSWKQVAAEAPNVLYAAEIEWYNKNISPDIPEKLTNVGVPSDIASDPRVQAYFSDRVVQQGPASIDGMAKHQRRIGAALRSAGNDPVEFLKAMTEADRGALQNDFPTALKTGVYSKRGHDTRLDGRLNMSLGMDSRADAQGSETVGKSYKGPYQSMSPGARLELMRAFQNEYRDQRRAASILSGTLPLDPGNKQDRETIDKAFEATRILDNLESRNLEASDYIAKLAKSTSYIPARAVNTLRGMAVNGETEDRHYAYQTLGRIMRERPGALQTSGGEGWSKAMTDEVETFNTLVMDVGTPAEQAIARIDEMRSAAFKARQDSLRGEADKIVKDLDIEDLTREYSGWFTSRPSAGGSDRRASFMLDAYRDMVRYHYIRSGDAELAKQVALNEMKKAYNVSEVTGNKRLMRTPPENFYPPIQTSPDDDPSYDYFREELKRSVNEAAGRLGAIEAGTGQRAETDLEEIPLEDIYIEANHQTFADIASGNPYPSFGVVWKQEDENGIPAFVTMPRNFYVDVKAAQEQQAAQRRATLQQQRKEAESYRTDWNQSLPRRIFLQLREQYGNDKQRRQLLDTMLENRTKLIGKLEKAGAE